ncbi:hypothetical protein V5R04_08290 [Jonesiaceae bacterium BS-20]|uniref:Uncharacterized protein n=1 Tax=Jonesiaceae bacterium BS-20 TaxID=3120821 RepID=A0AAU7DT54_9MICO
MQVPGLTSTTFVKPTYLDLAFIHSGHVYIRLLARNHWKLASAEFHVTDRAAIIETLSHWSSGTFSESVQEPYVTPITTHDYRNGFKAVLSEGEYQSTQSFAPTWEPLQSAFTRGLAGGRGIEDPEAASSFAHEAAQQFAAFFTATQKLCKAQLATGQYGHVLAGYLETTMSKVAPSDQSYYHEWQQTIGAELRGREYLRLAQDPQVRHFYCAILSRGQQLYNWSQMRSRLGISSSFEDRM